MKALRLLERVAEALEYLPRALDDAAGLRDPFPESAEPAPPAVVPAPGWMVTEVWEEDDGSTGTVSRPVVGFTWDEYDGGHALTVDASGEVYSDDPVGHFWHVEEIRDGERMTHERASLVAVENLKRQRERDRRRAAERASRPALQVVESPSLEDVLGD